MARYLICFICLAYASTINAKAEDSLTIFAAASMHDALIEHAQVWTKKTGNQMPRFSIGASAIMARQIATGAPADIFISANSEWAYLLETQGLLSKSSRPLVSNRLVLVAPSSFKASAKPEATTTYIRSITNITRLALADPATAPAGVYARTFLKKIGAWVLMKDRIAYATNVRQALLLAERGGLPAIVYGSDAKRSKHVKILFVIPKELSAPIVYTAGLLRNANKHAENFLTHLSSREAKATWLAHGFQTLVPE